jgi:hypothetical protein
MRFTLPRYRADDPAFFGGYVNANYERAALDCALTKEELWQVRLRESLSPFRATGTHSLALHPWPSARVGQLQPGVLRRFRSSALAARAAGLEAASLVLNRHGSFLKLRVPDSKCWFKLRWRCCQGAKTSRLLGAALCPQTGPCTAVARFGGCHCASSLMPWHSPRTRSRRSSGVRLSQPIPVNSVPRLSRCAANVPHLGFHARYSG